MSGHAQSDSVNNDETGLAGGGAGGGMQISAVLQMMFAFNTFKTKQLNRDFSQNLIAMSSLRADSVLGLNIHCPSWEDFNN